MTEKEFTAAAERHLDMVYRVALNCLRNQADAEDAAQTVLLRLWRSGQAFPYDDQLRYWLVRVTVNACKNLRRSPWRTRTVGLEQVAEPAAFQPEEGGVLEEVQKLPAKYREVLVLYYYLGYDTGEIAALLNIRPEAVRARMSLARRHLKAELEGQGYGRLSG